MFDILLLHRVKYKLVGGILLPKTKKLNRNCGLAVLNDGPQLQKLQRLSIR